MALLKKGHPDRYSCILVREEEEIPALIKAAKKLGMTWFVESLHGNTRFYLFFDEEGKAAYLSGAWNPEAE